MKKLITKLNACVKSAKTAATFSLLLTGTLLYAGTGNGKKGEEKVKMKIIKIIDGDTTIIEKIVPRSKVVREEEGDAMIDSLKRELKIFRESKDGKAFAEGFAFGDDMQNFKWEDNLDSVIKSFHLEYRMDSLLERSLGKGFQDKMITIDTDDDTAGDSNYNYNFKDDGKDRKITVKSSAKKKIIIKGDSSNVVVENEQGNNADNDDVEINITDNKGEKKETKIIIRSRVKMEDVNGGLRKADRKNTLKVENLNFYPNPSSGKFNLEFEVEGSEHATIKVSDINGKEIYKEAVSGEGRQSRTIDVGTSTKGIYILNLTQGKRSISKKIVIE